MIIPVNGGWQPAFIRLLTWLQRKKMVIVGHAGIGWDDANNLWSFPDCFVALSSYAQKWAKKVNPLVETVVVPDGVDLMQFKPKGNKVDIGLKRPIVLSVGALTKSKRFDLTIKAVAKLKNASLLIVGEGELKDEISQLGKNLLEKRFKIMSFPFDQMPAVYRSCDVFVSASAPSHSFEMVLLEAMAAGIPIISTKAGGIPEFLGDNFDWYIDIGDKDKLAELFCKISQLSPDELNDLVISLQNNVKNNFDYDDYYSNLNKLLCN